MMNEKLAYLRMTVALSLPQIKQACPEAHARLTKALEETVPGLAELAIASIEELREIERECAFARPQAMGIVHKEGGA